MIEADARQVERVRQMLVAGGGWNRRSRGALLAWARAEGVDGRTLERLLARAIATHAPVRRDATPESAASPRPPADRPRWWLAALAATGLVVSALLVMRLAPRIETPSTASRASLPTAAPASVETARTLPPAPVSFPSPPEIRAPDPVEASATAQTLGARPAGPLTRASAHAWVEAFVTAARSWPLAGVDERAAVLATLAEWVAVSDAPSLRLLREERQAARARLDAREDMLADALEAMLVAQVRGSARVAPAVAADPAFAGEPETDACRALEGWAARQVAVLAADLGAPDARARWSAWLQAAAAVADERARVSIALAAIDAILRTEARLDGQGLAADALGSLLAGVPSRAEQPGFDAVRDRWIAWLRDAGLASPRLWALGGIWRARGEAPDAWLLPGERDGPQARAALAERWTRLAAAGAVPPWQPLLAELSRPVPRPSKAWLVARVDDLAARARLVRRAASPSSPLGAFVPGKAAPAEAERAAVAEVRWARDLASPTADVRERALRAMRAEAPDALAAADAAALAVRAVGAQSREERALAQDVVRGALAESRTMRDAIAREIAVSADPRVVAEFLERLLAFDLAFDDPQALRAAALAGLLRPVEPTSEVRAVEAALRRLADELRAWVGRAESPDASDDPAAVAWTLARRAADEAVALRVPPNIEPLVRGLGERLRRLDRLAPHGPRGFAAALAALCDARAVRLAVRHAAQAVALRRIADEASGRRARALDALQQAAISLDALAAMHLLVEGAPVPTNDTPAPTTPTDGARDAARAEIDRADALAAADPVDRKAVAGALRHALTLDPARAGEVALAFAALASDAAVRTHQLESAVLLGAGGALPPPDTLDPEDGVALAQVLAWSERGQADRLVAAKLPDRVRPAVARVAEAAGSTVEDCLELLRGPASAAQERLRARLRSTARHALEGASAGWADAVAASDWRLVPEGDTGQPWRFIPPGG